jgi:hypothetical protein
MFLTVCRPNVRKEEYFRRQFPDSAPNLTSLFTRFDNCCHYSRYTAQPGNSLVLGIQQQDNKSSNYISTAIIPTLQYVCITSDYYNSM